MDHSLLKGQAFPKLIKVYIPWSLSKHNILDIPGSRVRAQRQIGHKLLNPHRSPEVWYLDFAKLHLSLHSALLKLCRCRLHREIRWVLALFRYIRILSWNIRAGAQRADLLQLCIGRSAREMNFARYRRDRSRILIENLPDNLDLEWLHSDISWDHTLLMQDSLFLYLVNSVVRGAQLCEFMLILLGEYYSRLVLHHLGLQIDKNPLLLFLLIINLFTFIFIFIYFFKSLLNFFFFICL